jgi:hypothetical protein
VTGLATRDASYIYVGSRNQNITYRYTAPAISSRVTYLAFTGASQTRDIAIMPSGEVWVATDWTAMPLRLYNTSGTMIDNIANTLVPAARGVTIDEDGYLWVSDIVNDKIYKIDLTEGIEGSGAAIGPDLAASSNPFAGQVTITGTGFDDQATIGVYDIRGNLVSTGNFTGSYVLGESTSLSRGVYFARVSNGNGGESVLRLMCL